MTRLPESLTLDAVRTGKICWMIRLDKLNIIMPDAFLKDLPPIDLTQPL